MHPRLRRRQMCNRIKATGSARLKQGYMVGIRVDEATETGELKQSTEGQFEAHPLRAPPPKEQMQGVRGIEHLRAPTPKEHICEECRGSRLIIEHLRAPAPMEPKQGVRGRNAQQASASTESARAEYVKGVRGSKHLAAPRGRCKECGGSSICLHWRRRSQCNLGMPCRRSEE